MLNKIKKYICASFCGGLLATTAVSCDPVSGFGIFRDDDDVEIVDVVYYDYYYYDYGYYDCCCCF